MADGSSALRVAGLPSPLTYECWKSKQACLDTTGLGVGMNCSPCILDTLFLPDQHVCVCLLCVLCVCVVRAEGPQRTVSHRIHHAVSEPSPLATHSWGLFFSGPPAPSRPGVEMKSGARGSLLAKANSASRTGEERLA